MVCEVSQVFDYVDDVFLPKVARIDAAIAETGFAVQFSADFVLVMRCLQPRTFGRGWTSVAWTWTKCCATLLEFTLNN